MKRKEGYREEGKIGRNKRYLKEDAGNPLTKTIRVPVICSTRVTCFASSSLAISRDKSPPSALCALCTIRGGPGSDYQSVIGGIALGEKNNRWGDENPRAV